MVNWILNGVISWIAGRIRDLLAWLLAALTSSFFTTPDVTTFPQVRALAVRSNLLLDGAFGLTVVVAGLIAMTYDSLQVRYQLKDLVPRLAFSFVASQFGVQICSALIGFVNSVTVAMIGKAAAGPRVIAYVEAEMAISLSNAGVELLEVICAVLIVILLLQLLMGWFFRVVTAVVLAGLAPAALGCYALPQLQPAAQLWWRTLGGCLAVPALQGVTLSVGVDLVLDPSHNLTNTLHASASAVEMLNMFFVLSFLALTVRIPRLVARYAAQRGGQLSPLGLIVRTVVVQTVARRVPGARLLTR